MTPRRRATLPFLPSLLRCAPPLALLLAWSPAHGAVRPPPPRLSASAPDGAGGTIVVWEDHRNGADIYAQRLNAAGAMQWPAGGVAICTATGLQQSPQSISDGAGGAIVTWTDSRSGSTHIYAQRVDSTGVTKWTPGGIALCIAASFQANPAIASDDSGGAIVVWEDMRGTNRDIYAQRVNAIGVPQWTTDGVPVCTAARDQITPQIISDGTGGAIMVWSDIRYGADDDIFAQRIDASGSPQWMVDGVPLCLAASNQYNPELTSDGASGAIVVWEDHRNGVDSDIYVQRVDATGAPQWANDGLAMCAAQGDQLTPVIVADGAGGAIATWEDDRIGTYLEADIYARRVNGAGVLQWATDGVALCAATGRQWIPQILADGIGGAFVTWEDGRSSTDDDVYAQRVDSTGVAEWSADGVALSTPPGDQTVPQIGPDGAGGAVVSWGDERTITDQDVYAQRVSGTGVVQWPTDGAAVHIEPGVQRLPVECTDGGTGVFIAWQEKRGQNYDIVLRRFDATGAALWPATLVCKAANAQMNAAITPDGAGGALLTWVDYRGGRDPDIYLQRVSAAGVAEWTADGVAVCVAAGNQLSPQLVSDGAGGAIVTWTDGRGQDFDIYAQRVDGTGVPLWPGDGVPICTASSNQTGPQLVPDGAGGAVVTWQDLRNTIITASDIYAQRVDGTGAPQWTADGVALCAATGTQRLPQIAADGAGGAIVAWDDRRSGTSDIYVRRVDANGTPQWTTDGVALCTATGNQDSPQIVPDGTGGAIVSWRDARSGPNFDVYARRVDASGTPQWTANGVALCADTSLQDRPRIAGDGAGGAIAVWEDHRNGVDADIYVQRVGASGAPQWTANGVALCTATGAQSFPFVTTDGAGGAFVAWVDHRDGIQDFVYMRRIGSDGTPVGPSDGTTPVLLSLASAAAWPGRVRLTGYAAEGAGLSVTISRSSGGGWSTIGVARADGTGRITFDDDSVVPGRRYGYRLGVLEGNVEHFSPETWVDVPNAIRLALSAVYPDPAVRDLWVSFSLANGAPASLGLYDLAGRSVRVRDVGGFGAGDWRVNLGAGGRLPPGVYVVRLTQGGVSLTRRLVVIR